MGQPSQPPGENSIVAGKYRLVGLLGRGGMGSVWEGVHTTLGTRVAVKFIETEFAHHEEVRDRFFNEAFAAARLQSKHIVQVYDHGVDDGGRPYIVMEFLSGEPLDQRLVREGTLTLPDLASLLQQVCRAVKKAHDAGIIHRDLKPENVFLVWDEEDRRDLVKVVDFGIAKFTDRSGITSATRTGAVIGTPHFMSPEQARGLKAVDERADVWSIGVIAYRAVTGVLPFDGEAVGDLLVKICTQEPAPPSSHVPLPAEFDRWMERALAKDPNERFAGVEQQASALLAAAGASDTDFVLSSKGERREAKTSGSAGKAGGKGAKGGKRLEESAIGADTSSPVAASSGPGSSRNGRGLVWSLAAVLLASVGGLFFWSANSGSSKAPDAEPPAAGGALTSALVQALSAPVFASAGPVVAPTSGNGEAAASSALAAASALGTTAPVDLNAGDSQPEQACLGPSEGAASGRGEEQKTGASKPKPRSPAKPPKPPAPAGRKDELGY